jgi:hypothetical protein
MAKAGLNPVFEKIRGAIGDLVFKGLFGRTVVTRKPTQSEPPSAAQLATRKRFGEAAAYARAVFKDPLRKAPYVLAGKARNTSAFALALADHMNLPEVTEVDLGGYFGHVGDPVKITARDDFELVSVTVTIKDAGGMMLEQGLAVNLDGTWTYVATTVAPVDQTIMIEASAKDRAGHERTLAEPWHA